MSTLYNARPMRMNKTEVDREVHTAVKSDVRATSVGFFVFLEVKSESDTSH